MIASEKSNKQSVLEISGVPMNGSLHEWWFPNFIFVFSIFTNIYFFTDCFLLSSYIYWTAPRNRFHNFFLLIAGNFIQNMGKLSTNLGRYIKFWIAVQMKNKPSSLPGNLLETAAQISWNNVYFLWPIIIAIILIFTRDS